MPPRSWHINASFLEGASMGQLVEMGKSVSLEHRRHTVDPTLLGLHEVGARSGVLQHLGRAAATKGCGGRLGIPLRLAQL